MKQINPVLFLLFLSFCLQVAKPVSAQKDTSVFTVSVLNKPLPGHICITAEKNDTGFIMILDQDGNIIKQKKFPRQKVYNFKKWAVKGKTYYTYSLGDTSVYQLKGLTRVNGYTAICDKNLKEIRKVYLYPYGKITTEKQKAIDCHDFILIDEDHFISLAFYVQTVTNIPSILKPAPGIRIVTPVMQEVKNNKVVWQWIGCDYDEFYTASMLHNNFSDTSSPQDYMHLNSMFLDPRDNNIICTFYCLNQIIKINKTTGKIMWHLGGKGSDFQLMPDQQFYHQHNVSLTEDGTLLLLDNGDNAARPYSRILEMKLDEVNKKIRSFKSFNIPEPFTPAGGSVQKKGDTYFISGGVSNYIVEVNYVTGQKNFELKFKNEIYRAYKNW